MGKNRKWYHELITSKTDKYLGAEFAMETVNYELEHLFRGLLVRPASLCRGSIE